MPARKKIKWINGGEGKGGSRKPALRSFNFAKASLDKSAKEGRMSGKEKTYKL